jgi:hypothetical protein
MGVCGTGEQKRLRPSNDYAKVLHSYLRRGYKLSLLKHRIIIRETVMARGFLGVM